MPETKKAAPAAGTVVSGAEETLTDTNIAQAPKLVKLSDVLGLLEDLADGDNLTGEWNRGYNAAIAEVTQLLNDPDLEVAPPAPEPDDLWSMLRKTCARSDGLVTGLECVCEAGNGHAYNIRLSIA